MARRSIARLTEREAQLLFDAIVCVCLGECSDPELDKGHRCPLEGKKLAPFLVWNRFICTYAEPLLQRFPGVRSLAFLDWHSEESVRRVFDAGLVTRPGDRSRVTVEHVLAKLSVIPSEHALLADVERRPENEQFARLDSLLSVTLEAVTLAFKIDSGVAINRLRYPLVLLCRANIDRVWALWQAKAEKRRDADAIFGDFDAANQTLCSCALPWRKRSSVDYVGARAGDPRIVVPGDYATVDRAVESSGRIASISPSVKELMMRSVSQRR